MILKTDYLINNIEKLFNYWCSNTADKKNYLPSIIPFIQLASILQIVSNNKIIDDVLSRFSTIYRELFAVDLTLNNSDFHNKVYHHIENIEKNKTTKLSKKEFAHLVTAKDNLYFHAYSRLAFSFGFLICNSQIDCLDSITNFKNELLNVSKHLNDEDFVTLFLESYNKLSFSNMTSKLSIDSVERHVINTQIHNLEDNILYSLNAIMNDDKLGETFNFFSSFNPYALDHKSYKVDNFNSYSFTNDNNPMYQINVGIKIKFSLISYNENDHRSLNSPFFLNAKLKESLTEICIRKKLESKSTKPQFEIKDLNKYFLCHEDISDLDLISDYNYCDSLAIDKKDFYAIVDDIQEKLNLFESEIVKNNYRNFCLKNNNIRDNSYYSSDTSSESLNCSFIYNLVKSFTRIEAFFYKLLFINSNKSKDFGIIVKNVFDPNESDKVNFKNIILLIISGKFHEHLFKMMENNEVCLSVSNLSQETISKFRELENFLQFLASDTGLIFQNNNIHLSFSLSNRVDNKNLLKVSKVDENNLNYNGLVVEFLKIIQKSLIKSGNKVNFFQDNNLLAIKFQIKKVDSITYSNNRALLNKSTNIIVSQASDNEGLIKIHIIGNNSTFNPDRKRAIINDHHLESLPPLFIEELTNEFNDFVHGLSVCDIDKLCKQNFKIDGIGNLESLELINARNRVSNSI